MKASGFGQGLEVPRVGSEDVVPVGGVTNKGGINSILSPAAAQEYARLLTEPLVERPHVDPAQQARLFGLTTPLGIESDPNTPAGTQPRPLMTPAITRSAIEVVSANLLTDKEDTAMIWRGPILSGVIRQFYEQVLWSDLDYLLIDLPPGTSDAPLTVLQSLAVDGVVLVTMPQKLATMIVRKAANLIHQLKKPILGVVENMSYFVAPDTGTRYDVFGPSYADSVAELAGAPMLGRLPINPYLVAKADAGLVEEIDDPIVDELAAALERAVAAMPQVKETISII